MIFLYIELFEQIGFSAEKSIREVKDVNESIHSLQKAIESVSKAVTDQTASARNFSSNMVTLSNGMTNFSENISEFEEAILAVSQTAEEAKNINSKIDNENYGQKASVQVLCEETKKLHDGVKDSGYRM